MNRRHVKLMAATMLFGVLSTGCGGGGGGGGDSGYSNASINGRYYGGHFNLNSVGTESAFKTMTFDGNGQASIDVTHNRIESGNGTIFSELGVSGAYSVQPDGSMSFAPSPDRGMVGAGGQTAVSARVDDNSVHNFSFSFKAGTGHTVAKLQGDYHGVGLKCTRPYDSVTKLYGECAWLNERNTLHLDGAGTYSASGWVPNMLDPTTPYDGTGDYSISDDGAGTVTGPDGVKEVWFSADGSLLMQAEIADNSLQKLYVGMRKGSGYSNASLKGTYAFAFFERSDTTQTSVVGTLVFDGTGGMTLQGVFSDETKTQQPVQGTTTYTLGADGLLTLILGRGALQGVVSADGRTLALVPWANSTHGILVAIRQ